MDKVSRVRKKGVNDMKPGEGADKGTGSQDEVCESMNCKDTAKEGTVKVKENGEGKKKLVQKDVEVAVEKIVAEKENKSKLDDGAVEKGKREKIYEEGDNDEIKQVKGKSEVSKKEGELEKGEDKGNDKIIMVKAEIGNKNVERKMIKQSIGEANMAAIENVNRNEPPEKRPGDKGETEQAEGDKAMVEVRKVQESDRMVNRANGAELAAGEEIDTNVYDNGELVFNIETYKPLLLFST